MSVVDDRVVEMKFNNQNFEKNVSTSMGTIDKLKKSLDFSNSGKSLDGLQRSVNSFSMSGIQESLYAIQDRFSTMGIVGMTIIQNLTNTALGMLAKVGSKISNMIIQGGISRAMNIENAKFQLEGLGIKYEEVFDAIDYAVTNTAYSLDAAASAASQLAASGLDYNKVIMTHEKDGKQLTQMSMALRAVSGVAAQTQTDYAQVARYFQDVANAGKVTGATLTYMTQVLNLPIRQNLAEGLKAIADGSMEASADVKKAVEGMVKGAKLEATDIDKFVKDGLISFDVFSTIMFGKFADHAVDANRTVKGVVANIGSAFAKIGAEFVSPLIEIDGIVVKMLDSIRAKVNELKPFVIPFAKSLTDSIKIFASLVKDAIDSIDLAWLKPFLSGLSSVASGLKNVILQLGYSFRAIFPKDTTKNMMAFGEAFKKFGRLFEKGTSGYAAKGMAEKFNAFFSVLSAGKTIISSFLSIFKGLFSGLKEGSSNIITWVDNLTALATKFKETVESSEGLKELSSRLFDAGKQIGTGFYDFVNKLFETLSKLKEGPVVFSDFLFQTDGLVASLGDLIIKLVETLTGKDLSKIHEFWSSLVSSVGGIVHVLAEALEWAWEKIKVVIDKIRELLGGVEVDNSGLNKIAETLNSDASPLEKVLGFIEGLISGFCTAINSVLPLFKEVFNALITPIKTFFTNMKEFVGGGDFLKEGSKDGPIMVALIFIMEIITRIKALINDVTVVGRLNTFLTSIGTAFTNFGKSMKMNAVGAMISSFAASILMIAIAMSVIAGIDRDRLGEATITITHLLGSLALIAKSLSSSSTTIQKGQKATSSSFTSFISLAVSIYILAMAISKVASVPADRLYDAFIVIEALLLTMTLIAKSLASSSYTILEKGQKAKSNQFISFIALAASIYILAMAVSKIANIPADRLLDATLCVEVLLLTMALITKLLSTNEGTKSSGGLSALGMIAMATSVLILAQAVKQLGDIPTESLIKGMISVEILLATMALVQKLLSTGESSSSKMIGAGVGMIAMAASMKIFASAAADFAMLDWEDLAKAGAAIGGILALITVFSKLTGSSSTFLKDDGGIFKKKNTAQSMIELGVGLIALGLAMKIFASAAEDFAGLRWEDLAKGGAALTVILVEVGAFSKLVSGGNLMKVSAGLLIFGVAMLTLVPAIMAFGSMPVGAVITSIVEMVAILAILGGAAYLLQSLIPSILLLNVALLAFGVALMAVGVGLTLFSGGVAAAFGVLDMIIEFIIKLIDSILNIAESSIPKFINVIFKLITELLKSFEEYVPMMVESIFNIITQIINKIAEKLPELAGALNNLVGSLISSFNIAIGEIDPEQFIMMMAGLSLFMVSIAAAATMTQSAMLGVLGIAAVMAVVALLFVTIKSIGYEADEILMMTTGLSEILLSLAATMLIISLIPIPAAAMGVAGLAIVVAGIAAILAILGGLAQIPGFEWLLGEGKRVLVQIGDAIGSFVGSIISGFGVALTSGLPEIADNLSKFALHLIPFITTMKMIDLKVVAAVTSLTAVIIALTAADILNGLTAWFTGGNSIEKFGEDIEKLAPHLKNFANEVKGINAEDMKAAAEAGKALAEMAKALPNEGGVAAFFAGENDMAAFGEKLTSFGKSLVEYSDVIKDLNVEAVEKSAAAGKMVAEMADMIPNTGGVAGFFAGENDMGEFGNQLVSFGRSLSGYSNIIDELNVEAIEKSAAAGTMMSDMASTLPNTGGAVSWFTGDNKLDVFGQQLVLFGGFLVDYSGIIKDLNTEAIEKSRDATQIMIDLSAQLENSGGAVSWFTGDNDLESFGKNLQSFGTSLALFSDSVQGVQITNVDGLIDGIHGLVDLSKELVDTDTDSLTRFAKNAKTFVSQFEKFGDDYVTKFISEFTGSVDKVNEGISAFVGYIISALENKINDMLNEGQRFAKFFISGLRSKISDVKTAGKDIGTAAVKGLESAYPAFYNVGVNCIMGIVNGLYDEDSIYELSARLSQIAEVMIEIIQGKLKEHSPSRAFMEIGAYAVEGLVIGLEDKNGDVANATGELADEAISGMRTVIDKIRDSIDDEMNLSPTITPVVDLSNVTKSAADADALFNRSVFRSNVRARSSIVQPTDTTLTNLQNEQQNGSRFGTTFIQNNYSPKALNRIEIYRQTRNQFAQYREAMQ